MRARLACLVCLACLAAAGAFDVQRWTYNASLWWTSAALLDEVDGPQVVQISQLLTSLTHDAGQLAMMCLGGDCEQGLCFAPHLQQELLGILEAFVFGAKDIAPTLSTDTLRGIIGELATTVEFREYIPGCAHLEMLLLHTGCVPAIHESLECARGLSDFSKLGMSRLHAEQIRFTGSIAFHSSLGAHYAEVLLSLLRRRAEAASKVRAAEVGVFEGRTAELLLSQLSSLEMLLVDPFDAADEEYFQQHSLYEDRAAAAATAEALEARMAPFRGRSWLLKAQSVVAAQWVAPELLDLVFLDANHGYEAVRADLHAWLPKVRRFGVLAGHDYSLLWPGVCRAVQEFSEQNGVQLNLGPEGLWWFRV
ncbi:unnamed protein product [Effrenium voratum]|nr:unnamed protein product [Effrenium voratum]